MASISTNKENGRREIQFVDTDGSRKTLRLGKVSMKDAQAIRTQVELLLNAKRMNTAPPPQTAIWLREVDSNLQKRLSKVKLIPEVSDGTLGPFLNGLINTRTDAKEITKTKWRVTMGHVISYFGSDRRLRSITAGDADEFRLFLTGRKLAENTVRSQMAICKMFFNAALRKKLVDENPFVGQKSSTLSNPERFHFISKLDTQRLIEAAPDWQWRLIIGLSRYGGLRCPSEVLALRWSDVCLDRNRIKVPCPKTAHTGKSVREIPMFPELKPLLEIGIAEAEPGEFVVTRYRDCSQNLRTTFSKIIKRAGLDPWPKLFQNMRSSRETELIAAHPIQVVTAWLGNTPKVALMHYLQVTEADFQKATQIPTQQPAASLR